MDTTNRRRRGLKVTAIILAVLVVAFYLGGGWYFSSQIHTDALTPLPSTPDNGLYVIGLAADTITITSIEERSDSKQPGTYGLDWSSGYGRIGEIVTVDGLDVTREFEIVDGPAPDVCTGALDACDQVDIDGWTFESDPGDVGLDFTEVQYQSPLGAMGAWRIDAGDGSVWAIHAHGWRAARREALRFLPVYRDAGITSLVIEYRNDPDEPADPSGLYRFGRTEWADVAGAIRYAVEEGGANKIILVGYSTGASAEMSFLENSPDAGLVTAAVFDSPNIDMRGTVRAAAAKRTIPGTPLPIPGSLISVALAIADMRWDVDWGAVDYHGVAPDLLTMPTLVFHGTADSRVPIESSRRLAEGSASVELIEVPEADHVRSWNVDPLSYQAELAEFLAAHG